MQKQISIQEYAKDLTTIKKISRQEASEIIESFKPRGLFYTIDTYKGKNVYVGIDNLYGDCWTEDFKSLSSCKRWLRQELEV